MNNRFWNWNFRISVRIMPRAEQDAHFTRARRGGEMLPDDPPTGSNDEDSPAQEAYRVSARSRRAAVIFALLTPVELTDAKYPKADDTCVICLAGLLPSDEDPEHIPCKLDACQHVIGRSCLSMWLADVKSCPLCRTPVRTDFRAGNFG